MRLLTIAESKPLIVSMGDPDGIGPEIIAKAWAARIEQQLPAFAVTGNLRAFANIKTQAIADIAQTTNIFAHSLPLLDFNDAEASPGAQSFHALGEATRLVREGQARALITAPVSKSRLHGAAFMWPGQTEYLACQSGVAEDDAVMMLAGGDLRTVPLTIHIPLADVSKQLTIDLILRRARTVAKALQADFGIAAPRLVIAGLNPHAGENGSIGREDIDIITPAVAQLQAEGLNIRGPLSADTLFHAAARQQYDAVLCGYHDQALIPIKTLYFDSGVNVTLGLPIVRTSPDHGTAFDIAGKNIANPAAMIAAITLADQISSRRNG
jgi:4-hydroxythreonine-4-phosphate dehydrogenase